MARYSYGTIIRLSPKTNVCDCGDKVKAYVRELGHTRSTIGDLEVWLRYSDEPKLQGRGRPYVAQVGPTRESVEKRGAA